MKALPVEFCRNVEGMGKHTFREVMREGNAAIYRRSREDGTLFGFEVFKVTSQRLSPRLGIVDESEVYPRANRFGKTAWFCMTMQRAMSRFETILKSEKERES